MQLRNTKKANIYVNQADLKMWERGSWLFFFFFYLRNKDRIFFSSQSYRLILNRVDGWGSQFQLQQCMNGRSRRKWQPKLCRIILSDQSNGTIQAKIYDTSNVQKYIKQKIIRPGCLFNSVGTGNTLYMSSTLIKVVPFIPWHPISLCVCVCVGGSESNLHRNKIGYIAKCITFEF